MTDLTRNCPVCGSSAIHFYAGEYERDGMKLSPDELDCPACGFFYQEHVKHPVEGAIVEHRKWLKAEKQRQRSICPRCNRTKRISQPSCTDCGRAG